MSGPKIKSALDLAAKARQARTGLEAELSSGQVSLSEVFQRAETDPLVARLKVMPLLDALPDVKKIDVRRFLESAAIDEMIKLQDLDSEAKSKLLKGFG